MADGVWLKIEDAARLLRIKPNSVRRSPTYPKRGPKGEREAWVKRQRLDERRLWDDAQSLARPDEWVPWGAEDAHMGAEDPESAPDAHEASERVERIEDAVDGWIRRKGYAYDVERDVYVIHLPSQRRQFVRPGSWVRGLWRKYTSGAQINETAREFSLDRHTLTEIKLQLGLTHTSAPWTPEETAQRAADELVDDGLAAKEREVLTRIERRDWARIKRKAQHFDERLAWIREVLREAEFDAPVLPRYPDTGDVQPFTLLVGLTDLHVGKRTAGEDHTLAEQVSDLERYIDELAEWSVSAWGRPERFILPVGGDALHSDTLGQTTTKGTPQGPQSVGTTRQAWWAAVRIYARLIDRLHAFAPVHAVWWRGNHDEMMSYSLAGALSLRYRNTRHVDVDLTERPRQYVAINDVPLMLCHGDKVSPKALPLIMAREMPKGCDISKGIVAHGHWHRSAMDQEDHSGIQRICLRSPARADDYHRLRGYTGAIPGTTLCRIDPDYGLRGTLYV